MVSRTDTSPTERSAEGDAPARRTPAIAVVLETDRLEAGCFVASIERVCRVLLTRGEERGARRNGAELTLELPDRRISRPHAALERDGSTFALRDLGSSNGTFLGGFGDAARVDHEPVAFEQPFRVGHCVLALIGDAAPILERAQVAGAEGPWPFATLSAPFARELTRLERVAASTVPLLLLGETGTGKEILARAVHARSGRPGAFVAVNCGALPANLVEAHLFGHLKGAFSGALRDELGFVRAAEHGTLFLDEIGDLAPSTQASLLRVLQEGEVTPVGAFHPVRVDVRIVSATHHALPERVATGAFRADLLGRLDGFTFDVPPLRKRRFDVGELLASFARQSSAARALRPDAALALLAHDYPMNVRGLKQAFHAASVLAKTGTVRLSDLPAAIREPPAQSDEHEPETEGEAALRAELEARLLATGYNLTQVARDMGKARQQVQRWVKRFAIKKPAGK
jgi:transcriptional regulator of acetoin/glycerol metabolism